MDVGTRVGVFVAVCTNMLTIMLTEPQAETPEHML